MPLERNRARLAARHGNTMRVSSRPLNLKRAAWDVTVAAASQQRASLVAATAFSPHVSLSLSFSFSLSSPLTGHRRMHGVLCRLRWRNIRQIGVRQYGQPRALMAFAHARPREQLTIMRATVPTLAQPHDPCSNSLTND